MPVTGMKIPLETETAALGFAAMGSKARLEVLRHLVKAGAGGLAVGDIQALTGLVPSTLAHHLRSLREAGLIQQEKQGRVITSRADFAYLEQLASYILSECCVLERT